MASASTRSERSPAEDNVCSLTEVTDRYVWPENLLTSTCSGKTSSDVTEMPPSSRGQQPIDDLAFRNCHSNAVGANSNTSGSFPRLDISLLASSTHADKKKLIEQMTKAAEEWGFFQVINHGVSESVVDDMLSSGLDFFHSLPVQVKELAVETDASKHTYYHGYGGRFQHLQGRVPWLEYLGESYHPVNGAAHLFNKVSSNYDVRSIRNAVERYSDELVKLGRRILEALAEGLDLRPDYFSRHFEETEAYQAHWRFNHYPACPEPSKTLGLGAHTDPCALTIVKQDNVGGFQLMNGGRWLDVQPLDNAFLVNIGDCLQAWTNGRFASVNHRVLTNKDSDRLSVVFPLSPPRDCDIQVPPTLVDEDHPLKFPSPITWHHLAVVKGNHVKSDTLSSTFGLQEKQLHS